MVGTNEPCVARRSISSDEFVGSWPPDGGRTVDVRRSVYVNAFHSFSALVGRLARGMPYGRRGSVSIVGNLKRMVTSLHIRPR